MNPKPEQIKAARQRAGLSQRAAGELIYRSLRTWQDWEYGYSPMDRALWEFWNIKATALKELA